GTLQLGAAGTSGIVTGSIVDNGTLVINHTDDITLANTISGTGGFTQGGTDNLTLSGTNTFSGTTTITAGYFDAGQFVGAAKQQPQLQQPGGCPELRHTYGGYFGRIQW
ncbi:MAG: hypothetical protein QM796_09690, partial [Chthoniobacteraceae bacterium]